jgi:type I restriction enzyme S subunit
LSDVLELRKEPVTLKGKLGDWQAITIKFSGAVIPREREVSFKGAMFAAYPGDLVFSKIDARNGAIGLIPDEIPKAIVTSEYPIFIPKPDKLRPVYLRRLLQATHFRADLQSKASGTSGRKRITPEGFLSLSVPVPSLPEQDELVARYSAALNEAASKEHEAHALEQAGWQAFESELGVAPPPLLPDRPVFIAQFAEIERWSHAGVLSDINQVESASGPWPLVALGKIGKVSYGIQKCPTNRPTTHARPYLRVANVQRGFLDLRKIKFINVPEEEMPKLRLEYGDVLLCEGNSPELVGRCAIWRDEIEDCVHQNHVLRVRLDQSQLLPEFVLSVINSGHGQAYFRSKAKRTTNLASINSKEVAGLPVPVPSIPQQSELLEELNASLDSSRQKRAEADGIRLSAWNEFESALFETPELVVG